MTQRLSIREVTRENWREALGLSVFPEQQRFIANAVPIAAIALAKAYIRPGGLIWFPYAFYDGSGMVGFTMLAYEPESEENYWIYHFFIDYRYQRQGYGKEALHIFLRFIQDQYTLCKAIQLTVHPENERAQRLYINAGFQATGAALHDEPVYLLQEAAFLTRRT